MVERSNRGIITHVMHKVIVDSTRAVVLASALAALGSSLHGQGAAFQRLAVPAARLTAGCALAPSTASADSKASPANLAAGLSLPTNPWSGADGSLPVTIRAHILGVPPLPGGAVPEDLEEAYAAIYASAGKSVVVQAVRFKGTPPTIPLRGDATQRSVRIERERTVVVVSGADEDPCFDAVARYLRETLAPSTAQPAR